MLANLIIALSSGVACLGVIDFFMSDAQKKKLSDVTLKLWNWLDELKRKTFIEWLSDPIAQRLFLTAAGALALAGVLSVTRSQVKGVSQTPIFIVVFTIIMPFVLWIGPKVMSAYLLLSQSRRSPLILRLLLLIVTLTLLQFSVILYLVGSGGVQEMTVPHQIATIVLLAFTFFLGGFLVIFLIIIIFIYTARDILGASEFVVRRIAEYPKGPLLAISTLVTGIVAFFKAVG